MQYVYGDIFFAVNLAINYLLMYTTGYLTRQHSTMLRLSLAALLGAVYALGFLAPVLGALYHPLVVLLFPGVMVWIAFRPRSLGQFLYLAVAFYAVTLMVAGAALALASLRGGQHTWPGSSVPLVFPAWGYAIVAVVALTTVAVLRVRAGRQERTARQLVGLEATLVGQTVRFKALVDTGLMLEEPLSGGPVVLADEEVALRLLPTGARSLPGLEEALVKLGLTQRLRFVPYDAVGRAGGVLPGVTLDRLRVVDGPSPGVIPVPVTLAWAAGVAADDRSFEALVGPDIHDSQDGREQLA